MVIRALNSASTLEATLLSLIAQSQQPGGIVVVDSGSTDATVCIAERYGAQILHYACNGAFNYSEALNIGFKEAKTELILSVSSHVQLTDVNICSLLIHKLADPNVAVAFVGHGRKSSRPFTGDPVWAVRDRDTFSGFGGNSNSCAMYRRCDWQAQPFDETIPTAEDIKWARDRLLSKNQQTWCLCSPSIAYLRNKPSLEKSINEKVAICRYVYSEIPLRVHAIRLLLNAMRWFVKGKFKISVDCIRVAYRLIINK